MEKAPSPHLDKVRADEQHLLLAQEAAEIGTWEWDLVSGCMKWSPQMFRNLGCQTACGYPMDEYPMTMIFVHAWQAMVVTIFLGCRDAVGAENDFVGIGCRSGNR